MSLIKMVSSESGDKNGHVRGLMSLMGCALSEQTCAMHRTMPRASAPWPMPGMGR